MTLLSYQIFKTVAEAGSFHKAADLIGLTPSAISHAVSSMEKELGFSVFTRKKAGVTLTGYGEHLMPYVNAVLLQRMYKLDAGDHKVLRGALSGY